MFLFEIRGNIHVFLLQIRGNIPIILLQQRNKGIKIAEAGDLRYFVCFKYLVVKVSRNLTYLYYHLHGFLHCLHADKLVRSVEVAAAGEDVRAWQTLE